MKRHLLYLALLFRLKCLLVWRTYCRDMSAAVGAILALVFFLPLSLVAALGCWAGFTFLQPRMAEHLLRGVLLAAYVLWLASPLIGYALTEDYDVAKLLVYPLSSRLIFAGAILGSLIDFGVLLLLPSLLAVLIAFTNSLAAFPIVLLAVALFLFHAVALSQTIVLAGAGILRSRRARDVMVVFIPLVMAAFYVMSQVVARRAVRWNWRGLLESRTWDVVSYLPSGLAARAIAGAGDGDYTLALVFLLALGLVSAGTLYLAGWLVHLVHTGEVVSGPTRRRAASRREAMTPSPGAPAQSTTVASPLFGLRLAPPLQAVLDKEIKYLFRDPYFRFALMMTFYVTVVLFIVVMRPGGVEVGFAPGASQPTLWAAAGILLMTQAQLPFNIFGTEGFAVSLLFLFPTSRRRVLIGKNVVLFVALSGVNCAILLALSLLAKDLAAFPRVVLWLELALVVMIGCGNLVSVWLPNRVTVQGWRVRQQSSSRGLTYGLTYLAAMFVFGCLSLPVLAAVAVPGYWVSPLWYALTIPIAAAYAAAVYLVSLGVAEKALLGREPEIVGKLSEKD